MVDELAQALNLGPKSAEMLRRAGVDTLACLQSLGAVRAWWQVKAHDPRVSLNLLWALEGALSGRHWQVVARADRTRLLMELDALAVLYQSENPPI